MQTITATDLARNTREVLDLVIQQGQAVNIERNRTTVAQIVPPQQTMTAAQALAGLGLPTLSPAQADAWLVDSKAPFGEDIRDPWVQKP